MKRNPAAESRFWARVRLSERGISGCWIWTGPDGAHPDPWNVRPHRIAYQLVLGPLARTSHLVAACSEGRCVNPFHRRRVPLSVRNRDRSKGNRWAVGTSHPACKLTESEVSEIRRLYAAGGVTQTELADAYGISQPQVSSITRGHLWKHLLPRAK